MSNWEGKIDSRLAGFRKRYYTNLLMRGGILTLAVVLGYGLFALVSEYLLWMGPMARFALVALFVGLVVFCVARFLSQPLKWILLKKGLSPEDSARVIGRKLEPVQDKLLNLIQLSRQPGSALAEASLAQKFRGLESVPFEQVVDFGENRKILPYLAVPVVVFAALFISNQKIITTSANRLIHYNQEFSPQAPFKFEIQNKSMRGFYGEDFLLSAKLTGDAIPQDVYLSINSQLFKMSSGEAVQYTFERLEQNVKFQFYAAGFYSEPFEITVAHRPELSSLSAELQFPAYLNRKREESQNAGNFEIPEGTKITWRLSSNNATKSIIGFKTDGSVNDMQSGGNQEFTFSKSFRNPDEYSISLVNDESESKDKITYNINIIKDEYPEILVSLLPDSVLFKSVYLGGSLADDHGLTRLHVHYEITREGAKTDTKTFPIAINPKNSRQDFVYHWKLDSLGLLPGDGLSYYLQVWDNDGVNGAKSTKSASYMFHVPSRTEMREAITNSEHQTESEIDRGMQKAKSLEKSIEEIQERLKGKQTLDWQERAMLEDLIKQKQEVDKMLEQMAEENEMLEKKRDAFSERDERLKEKAEQIQKLMDELLDEETKKLFKELEKLLKEKTPVDQVQKMLNKIQQKENNVEKELERIKELFKEMKFESKMDAMINDLDQNIEEQKELLEKTEQLSENKKTRNNPDSLNALAEKQAELKEKTKEAQEKMDELEQLNEELENKEELPDDEALEEAEKQMEESEKNLKDSESKKSKENQKKAMQKMQEMKKKMEGMQNSMEMEMDAENMEMLRQILHGLVKLSFDQEKNMQEFNEVQQTDPRYLQLSQNQLKLQDDAKVLEDSLLALGKRDPFMGNIVIKEIGELNSHLDKTVENIRERRKPNASSEMQLSMTSINNLALMLNDHFEMMMEMMMNAKGSKSGKPKKGGKSLSEMQQQLNKQIEQIKNGGKEGRQLSEELAQMAAEQERIRKALQELQQKMNNGQKVGGDISQMMEQTEMDLVNKQITEQTIKRQKAILTRLLESEKSMREQDMEEERKGETAKDHVNEMPKEFLEYLKLKEKEVELLKTVPPKLYPFYKKEAGEYFKRIGQQ